MALVAISALVESREGGAYAGNEISTSPTLCSEDRAAGQLGVWRRVRPTCKSRASPQPDEILFSGRKVCQERRKKGTRPGNKARGEGPSWPIYAQTNGPTACTTGNTRALVDEETRPFVVAVVENARITSSTSRRLLQVRSRCVVTNGVFEYIVHVIAPPVGQAMKRLDAPLGAH